ncbi:uncharacterized protein TNCV_903761 [Trichonephila clavipes]|nr:uncharacterized protein TNCV_903761 [Trichonephila clavipes]
MSWLFKLPHHTNRKNLSLDTFNVHRPSPYGQSSLEAGFRAMIHGPLVRGPDHFGKPWETLAPVGPIPRHLERAEAVARFRLTTGHDFLGVYLHWLGVAANEACPICGRARWPHIRHWVDCNTLKTLEVVCTLEKSVHPWSRLCQKMADSCNIRGGSITGYLLLRSQAFEKCVVHSAVKVNRDRNSGPPNWPRSQKCNNASSRLLFETSG